MEEWRRREGDGDVDDSADAQQELISVRQPLLDRGVGSHAHSILRLVHERLESRQSHRRYAHLRFFCSGSGKPHIVGVMMDDQVHTQMTGRGARR
jgi:hypothetical protein